MSDNEKQKFTITEGQRVISIAIVEKTDSIGFYIECNVPGAIPDSRQYDNLLEETIAHFDDDPRVKVLFYEGKSAVCQPIKNTKEHLIAFGHRASEGGKA